MKNKVIIFLIICLTSFTVFLLYNSSQTKKKQDFYNVSIDLNKKNAVVDDEKIDLTDLLGISDKKLNDLIKSKKIDEYISKNMNGKVDYNNGKINITNPYSLKKLIVKTDNKEIFKKYNEIKKVNKISDGVYSIEFDTSKTTKDTYEKLKKNSNIDLIATDVKLKISENAKTSSVKESDLAWGYKSTGINNYITKLNAKEKENVTVAVLDTGIRYSHKAFSDKTEADRIDMEYAYDYVNSTETKDDFDPSDDNGHGTSVAGVIAESTPSNVKIIPMKVMDNEGYGDLIDILSAISDIGGIADIINLSLGIQVSEMPDGLVEIADFIISDVKESGSIVVCATGNEGADVNYPASSEYTIAAAAINSSNQISDFSNYGPEVDFALPGEDLKLPSYRTNSSYSVISGTSFSTPYLSSAIALIKSENKTISYDNIFNILKENSEDLGTTGKDNYFGYGKLNFNYSMFAKPNFISLSASSEWAKTNSITVSALSNSKINKYAIKNNNTEPNESEYNLIQNPTAYINFTVDTSIKNSNYVWLKNEDGKKNYSKVEINYIDDEKPTILENPGTKEVKMKSITTSLKTKDSKSGINKVIWYLKKTNETNYLSYVNSYDNKTSDILDTYTFNDLEKNTSYTIYAEIYDAADNFITTDTIEIMTLEYPDSESIYYQTHIQNVGWQKDVQDGSLSGTTGKSLRLEGIKIHLSSDNEYTGDVIYKTHVQNIGWQNEVKNGEMSGTSGKSLRLEAIQIKLSGEISNYYDIYYRTHVQNIGWTGWAKNYEKCGSSSYAYRLEGIQIKLVKKGENPPGNTENHYYYPKIIYRTHIQNVGWQGSVSDGALSGTTGRSLRLEGIKISLNSESEYTGDVIYKTHVQNIGWQNEVKNGEMSGTNGKSLRLEAIQIKLTGEMEEHYDVYYRTHVQNMGWTGWAKNDEQSGSAGYSYRLEGIQIKLVKKGESIPNSGTAKAFYSR